MNQTIQIGKKTYEVTDDLSDLANKIISEKNLGIDNVRIKYIKVYPFIGKKVAGRCVSSSPILKLFSDSDYLIQLSGDLWDNLDDDRKEILMYHELLHIMPLLNDKTGEWQYKLRDHDIKDFHRIIKEYGIDWFEEIKTIHSSVYDIDSSDMEGFGL